MRLLLVHKPVGLQLSNAMAIHCILSNSNTISDVMLECFPSTLQVSLDCLPDILDNISVGSRIFKKILLGQGGRVDLSQRLLDATLSNDNNELIQILLENTNMVPNIILSQSNISSLLSPGEAAVRSLSTVIKYFGDQISITGTAVRDRFQTMEFYMSDTSFGFGLLKQLLEMPNPVRIDSDLVETVLFRIPDGAYSMSLLASKPETALFITQPLIRKVAIRGHYEKLKCIASFSNVSRFDLELAYCISRPIESLLQILQNGFGTQVPSELSLLWTLVPRWFINPGVVDHLLQQDGVDVNFCSPDDGTSVLFRAVDSYEPVLLCKKLLKAGADPNQANHAGQIPLHIARDSEIVELLIDAGSSVNIVDADQSTPLHNVAGHKEPHPWKKGPRAMAVLINAGMSLDAVNAEGQSALHLAIQTHMHGLENDPRLPEAYICNGISLNSGADDIDLPVIDQPCSPAQNERCSSIENEGMERCESAPLDSSQDNFPWETAIYIGTNEEARHFPEEFYPRLKYLPLSLRLEWEPDYLPSTQSEDRDRRTETLIEAGANVNVQDKKLRSPLHYAADSPYLDVLSILLDNGGRPNLQDIDGRTALHLVARNGMATRAKLLVEAGADANCRDNEGKTALDLAREAGFPETTAYLESVTTL